MRKLSLLIAVCATSVLGACSTSSPETQTVLKAACLVDGVAQPIAVTVGGVVADVAGFGPEAQLAAGIDGRVHPAIQAACKALGGQASVSAPAATTVPAAAPAAAAVPATNG
jgi:hypothetical protein